MDIKFKPEDLVFIKSKMMKMIIDGESVPNREKIRSVSLNKEMVVYIIGGYNDSFSENELIPATKHGVEEFFENIFKTFVENHRKAEKLALRVVN